MGLIKTQTLYLFRFIKVKKYVSAAGVKYKLNSLSNKILIRYFWLSPTRAIQKPMITVKETTCQELTVV